MSKKQGKMYLRKISLEQDIIEGDNPVILNIRFNSLKKLLYLDRVGLFENTA